MALCSVTVSVCGGDGTPTRGYFDAFTGVFSVVYCWLVVRRGELQNSYFVVWRMRVFGGARSLNRWSKCRCNVLMGYERFFFVRLGCWSPPRLTLAITLALWSHYEGPLGRPFLAGGLRLPAIVPRNIRRTCDSPVVVVFISSMEEGSETPYGPRATTRMRYIAFASN